MCKKTSTGFCMPLPYRDYEKKAIPLIKIINSKQTPKHIKTQASEQLGTLAALAYNARRLKMSFSKSQSSHQEFSASGVFDLIYQGPKGEIEVKEAKGGKSTFGTCKDATGKAVKQCTQKYNRVVAQKMKTSNYNGKDPKIACANHVGNPLGACSACVKRERTRRRMWGKYTQSAMAKGLFRKLAIRGNYKKTCPLNPSVDKAYKVSQNGMEIPMNTPIF